MTPIPDAFTLAAALVGGLGLQATDPEQASGPAQGAAAAALRSAQVELYCDHEAEAMQALREARRHLSGETPVDARTITAVEQAAWHIRHHAMDEAQRSLDQARAGLA